MSAVLQRPPEAVHEVFALEALARACAARRSMERLVRGTPAYGAANHQRHLALERAAVHVATLHSLRYPISAPLRAALAAEEIAP